MGLVPTNTGGFGAILPAAQVFARNELEPLQATFLEMNDWLGQEVVRFRPYVVQTGEQAAAPELVSAALAAGGLASEV